MNTMNFIFTSVPDSPGIYVFFRVDPRTTIKYAYVGQAKSLLQRVLEHVDGYTQHIDCSIKKRGLYDSETNPSGWQVEIAETLTNDKVKQLFDNSTSDESFEIALQEELDRLEIEYIVKFANAGFQLLNVTGGGQRSKAVDLDNGNRKEPGTYRKGVKVGKQQLSKELNNIIDKHLDIRIKKEGNKTQQKMLEKFNKLLGR